MLFRSLHRFADLVAAAALGTPGPFTIGVFADWGQGKSSLLHVAKSLLDQPAYPHVVTVKFNACRYERESHPIVPLVATIERALAEKLEAAASWPKEVRERCTKWLQDAYETLCGVLYGASFKLKVDDLGFPGGPKVGGELGLDIGKGAARIDKLKAQRTKPADPQWDAWVSQCLYLSAFDRLDRVSASLFDGEHRPEDLPRIVVFIDDLDRCLPGRAFELLENIKLVLAQKGFVFVLALNRAVLDRYLWNEAVKRCGSDQAALLARHLDKIIQLPLPLPSHRQRFKQFVADVIGERLARVLTKPEADAFTNLSPLLTLGTQYTPRTLIRRINTLLVDLHLRKGLQFGGELGQEQPPYPDFLGLCLVQRTLQDHVDDFLLRKLTEYQDLCNFLAEKPVNAVRRWLLWHDPERPAEREIPKEGAKGEWPAPPDPDTHKLWLRIVNALYDQPFLDDLLREPVGQTWLRQSAKRSAVTDFVAERPEPSSPGAAAPPPAVVARDALPDQRSLIERAIRDALNLRSDAPLTAEALASVTELVFQADKFTDAGLKELARADTGLKALTSLDLRGTQVTDAGLKELARARPSLRIIR